MSRTDSKTTFELFISEMGKMALKYYLIRSKSIKCRKCSKEMSNI